MPYLNAADGARLHYEVEGAPDAPRLVLLHGLGSDAEGYRLLLDALDGRLRVACLDLRGHGGSEPLTDPSRYRWFDGAADDVVDLMDELEWESPGLAGGSLGAATSLATARRHPGRVSRLGLLAPALGAGPDHGNPVAAGFLAAVRDHGLLGVLDLLLAASPDALPAEVVAETRANWGRQDDAAMRACVTALASATLVDDLADLGRISVPTLVIGQRGDILHPWEMAEAYAAHIPGSRLEGGEVGFLLDPVRVAALLADFFSV